MQIQAAVGHTAVPPRTDRAAMFYDGGCPLCSKEVDHYRRIDKESNVRWIDIDADPRTLDPLGVDQQAAMQRLHALDRAGNLQTGVRAFLVVWDELPYYRWLSRLVRVLHLIRPLDTLYTRFARWRYFKRGCDSTTCNSV
jgi:predicted DCC family thiol-disulfide oxidoreductase YuxK